MTEPLAEFKRDAIFLFVDGNLAQLGDKCTGLLHYFEHTAPVGKNRTYTFWHGIAQITLGETELKIFDGTIASPVTASIELHDDGLWGRGIVIGGQQETGYYAVFLSGLQPFNRK